MKYVLFIALLVLFVSCDDRYRIINSSTVALIKTNSQNDTILKDSLDNSLFSRLYFPQSFGLIYTYQIPDAFKEKEIVVCFGGKIRTNYGFSNSAINVSVRSKNGVSQGWNGRALRYYFTDINTWCPFRDSIRFKHDSWQEQYDVISAFPFLGNSPDEKFDIKDFQVQIKVKE